MIDWLHFTVPYYGSPLGYSVTKLDMTSGEVITDFTTMQILEVPTYSAKVQVMATGSVMHFSGNPAKFLSGQNVVGSDDIHELVLRCLTKVFTLLGLPFPPSTKEKVMNGDVELKRVDTTVHFDVGSQKNVRPFLEGLANRATVKFRGGGMFNPRTLTLDFGKKITEDGQRKASRRSVAKFYCKFSELEANQKRHLPADLYEHLRRRVEGQVRFEVTIRRKDLFPFVNTDGTEEYLHLTKFWDEKTPSKIINKWRSRIQIAENIPMADETELKLSNSLRGTYALWKSGYDLRDHLSRATFYRHRQELLEYGIDILNQYEGVTVRNVVPIVQYIEADVVNEIEREEYFWQLVDGWE